LRVAIHSQAVTPIIAAANSATMTLTGKDVEDWFALLTGSATSSSACNGSTGAPHWGQKLANGNNDAPQLSHCMVLFPEELPKNRHC
jgi:hypothetical protein